MFYHFYVHNLVTAIYTTVAIISVYMSIYISTSYSWSCHISEKKNIVIIQSKFIIYISNVLSFIFVNNLVTEIYVTVAIISVSMSIYISTFYSWSCHISEKKFFFYCLKP